MAGPPVEKERQWFSRRVHAAGFGRYEGTRPAEFPAHDVLIGRDAQRAFFLNLLLTSGRKGAFLVTGHRGSGKTTFVRYCLDEYRNGVLDRFLAGNAGRAFLWDRLAYFAYGVLLIFAGLLMSESLQELSLLKERGLLDWLVIVALGLLCCYPLLKAFEIFGTAYGPEVKRKRFLLGEQTIRHPPKAELTYGLRLLAIAGMVCVFAPLGWPALAVSQLVALAGWLYLVVNALSFNAVRSKQDPVCADPSYTLAPASEGKGWRHKSVWFVVLAGALPIFLSYCERPLGNPLTSWRCRPMAEVDAIVVRNWLLAGTYLAVGLYRRARDQRLLLKAICSREAAAPRNLSRRPSWPEWLWLSLPPRLWPHFSRWLPCLREGLWPSAEPYNSLGRALATSAHWHGFMVLVVASLTAAGTFLAREALTSLPRAWAVPSTALLSAAALWTWASLLRARDEKAAAKDPAAPAASSAKVPAAPGDPPPTPAPFMLRPRPRILLAFKAVAFLVIGLELAFPLLPSWLWTRLPGAPLDMAEPRLFRTNADEVLWVAGVALLLLLCAFFEYEWIVRPYALLRGDDTLHRSKWIYSAAAGDEPRYPLPHSSRFNYQRFAESTFFWSSYSSWLPILIIPVNLGFDVLEYRQVIEAMLAGLRDRYRRVFRHWSSPLVMVRRCLLSLVLLWLALLMGERWFGKDHRSPVEKVLAKASRSWEEILELPPLSVKEPQRVPARFVDLMVIRLSGLEGAVPSLGSLRVYHLLMLVIVWVGGLWLSRALPLSPYRTTYRRISRLHQSLSSRLREESRVSGTAHFLGLSLGNQRLAGRESGPSDPRAVELAFLQVLADCQNPAIQLPFTSRHRLSLPVPEVIFVFDELDKLGTSWRTAGEPAKEPAPPAGVEAVEREPSDRERGRLLALQKLFGELKNILSSGDARFVFIGGRNLHDAWLADQSSRQPQLTSIFDAEIHLRSLLTDETTEETGGYLHSIKRFVYIHWRRAIYLHASWQQKKSAPWLWVTVEERRPAAFVAKTPEENPREPPSLMLRDCRDGEAWTFGAPFYDMFVDFLAYKSRGNVKKLNALLEVFLRPAGRYVADPDLLRDVFDCDHVLAFIDSDRYRIELVSNVVRELRPVLQEHLRHSDDKLGPGVFYLADYLLKFHRRAFTWANLGRIDELEHIHRAPDLRGVLEDIVLHWSESLLHLINNGMYDYRFESEFARELELLSQESEHELAAFNFTLDEAQALKSTYRARLDLFKDHRATDFVVGLGELFEFDEEFETARYYFRRAIHALDEELCLQAGQGEAPLTFEVMKRSVRGFDAARRIATWGVARVRLMLQIGMTYERAHDFEHGHSEYRDARTLASALVRALLGWASGAERVEGRRWKQEFDRRTDDAGGYLWTLKSLPILLHPVFAEAWLAEKSVAVVDTGPSLLERELWELRTLLPFVSRGFDAPVDAADAVSVQHSNFALTFAELHNKAGSLYFFKGRQLVPSAKIQERQTGDVYALRGTEGYLLKALSHYSISLHEIRRFNAYRRHSSAAKLNDHVPSWPTIGPRGWPEFAYRVAAGSLANFAEAFLARVSLFGLLRDLASDKAQVPPVADVWPRISALSEGVTAWLDDDGAAGARKGRGVAGSWSGQVVAAFPWLGDGSDLADWLGLPVPEKQWKASEHRLIEVRKLHTDAERLAHSFIFSLTSARLLAQAGYAAGAAQECLHVVQTITQYVWWIRLVLALAGAEAAQGERTAPEEGTWASVLQGVKPDSGLLAFVGHAANLAFSTLRRIERLNGRESDQKPYNRLHPTLAITACSLALGLDTFAAPGNANEFEPFLAALGDQVSGWTAKSDWVGEAVRPPASGSTWFRMLLDRSLERHSYPQQNRLRGLKALVDHAVLAGQNAAVPQADTNSYRDELTHLESRYNSPLHFTPIQAGVTLAATFLTAESAGLSGPERNAIRGHAEQKLVFSQQMYTLSRRYYEEIAGLYYLYDDFNDRTIHYNQSIQMAGTELTSCLLALIAAAPS